MLGGHASWDEFAADPSARCQWCFRVVAGGDGFVPTTPRDGFAPAAGKEIDPTNMYGMHGYWGRGHVQGLPQGGAPGALEGPGKRVLHQACVEKYNAAKGSKCLWCRSTFGPVSMIRWPSPTRTRLVRAL